MKNKEKKENNEERYDLTHIMRIGLIMFLITAVVLIVSVVLGIHLREVKNERDGYAEISMGLYNKTIFFTEVYEDGDIYIFYLVDGGEIQCHRDRVVIYYDEDKE